jgi:hypothetical protein
MVLLTAVTFLSLLIVQFRSGDKGKSMTEPVAPTEYPAVSAALRDQMRRM